MFVNLCNVGWRASLAGVVFSCGVGGFTDTARAQQGFGPPDERAHLRCGRARSLAGMPYSKPIDVPDRAYREALGDTDLLHYVLDLEVSDLDPVGNTCVLTGTNVMTIQSKVDSLTEFTFRLREQYVITGAYVNGSTAVVVTDVPETTRIVTLDRPYMLDEVFTLTIEYTGDSYEIPDVDSSIRVDTQADGTPIVATLSQPYFAYSWWPVKEGDLGAPGDNSDKCTLEIAITAPDTFDVPSNGLLQGVDVLTDNRRRHRWLSDYPVIPSLVAFAATEYNTWTAYYEHAGGTMPVEFYIYPDWDTPDHRAAWEQSITMIETFAALFGEYPFIDEKYGIYAFPWAGLEHQTMTAQGDGWGYDPFDEYLTVHELAHSWWGDAVSCKTWNHIWISEGFATYADVLWEEYKPGGGFDQLKLQMGYRRQYVASWGQGSVYVSDDEVADPWELFNAATSYYKGSWVLHMLRNLFGDETFFDVLRAFLAAHELQAADTEDFQAVCEDFYGGSLDWFFQQWIYGTGIPSYEWGWDYVEVAGQYYLLLSIDQTQSTEYPRFTMPVDIATETRADLVVFNDADPEHFVIPVGSIPDLVEFDPGDWILWSERIETTYAPGPPTIVDTLPAPGTTGIDPGVVDTVSITFHTNVNAAQEDISLVGESTGVQPFSLASGADVNPLVINLAAPLASDTYTLTVGDGIVASDSGMSLDGEVSDANDPASLPSGDGTQGGAAIIRFRVGERVPTVSQWGLTILALLLLCSCTIVLRARGISQPAPE